MTGYYHYDKLDDSVLITNDLGFYAILSKEEFHLFTLDAIPRDTDLWKDLSDKCFCTDESKEAFDELLLEKNARGVIWLHFAVRPSDNRRNVKLMAL